MDLRAADHGGLRAAAGHVGRAVLRSDVDRRRLEVDRHRRQLLGPLHSVRLTWSLRRRGHGAGAGLLPGLHQEAASRRPRALRRRGLAGGQPAPPLGRERALRTGGHRGPVRRRAAGLGHLRLDAAAAGGLGPHEPATDARLRHRVRSRGPAGSGRLALAGRGCRGLSAVRRDRHARHHLGGADPRLALPGADLAGRRTEPRRRHSPRPPMAQRRGGRPRQPGVGHAAARALGRGAADEDPRPDVHARFRHPRRVGGAVVPRRLGGDLQRSGGDRRRGRDRRFGRIPDLERRVDAVEQRGGRTRGPGADVPRRSGGASRRLPARDRRRRRQLLRPRRLGRARGAAGS